MDEIDTNKIRGIWHESKPAVFTIIGTDIKREQLEFSGGDDTLNSIKLVADKVNEIVEWINSKKDQLL